MRQNFLYSFFPFNMIVVDLVCGDTQSVSEAVTYCRSPVILFLIYSIGNTPALTEKQMFACSATAEITRITMPFSQNSVIPFYSVFRNIFPYDMTTIAYRF